MNQIKNLTKESFWNRMMELYPLATKEFCEWIDKYKEAVEWNRMFGGISVTKNGVKISGFKYHDIPYAMQLGIWMQYVCQLENEESYIESVFCDFGWHQLDKIIEKWMELRNDTLNEQNNYKNDWKSIKQ